MVKIMTGTIILRADFKKLASFANKTLDLTFNTSELSPESAGTLLQFLHMAGVVAFKVGDVDFTEEEIRDLPEVKAEFANQKSPSQRLHNVLFVYFEQKGGQPENFEIWRVAEMERIIETYKSKLEPE